MAIEFIKIKNDTNGNPRYVCKFDNLLTEQDLRENTGANVINRYSIALKRAKAIGGKKFSNNQYAGGIVFQSFNIKETEKDIINIVKDVIYANQKKSMDI